MGRRWSRPRSEIEGLMRLLKLTLQREEAHLNENNVRLETIGDISRLPLSVQEQLDKTRHTLSANTGLRLVLALNYGGRQDIIQACNNILEEGYKNFTEEIGEGDAHFLFIFDFCRKI